MTLSSIVSDVAGETGFKKPSTVIGNTNATAVRLLSLANREGKELASFPWQALQVETTILTDGTDSYDLPTDFNWPLTETWWDQTNFREIRSSTSAATWTLLQHGIVVSAGITKWARIQGDKILIFPSSTGETLSYEYISTHWAQNAVGDTTYAAWNADDDVGRLSEELMTLGLIWRWRKSNGLDFEDDRAMYNRAVNRAKARDGGMRVVDQSIPAISGHVFQVPEGNFG